jgi:branched-subunit amino acid transport protein
VNDALNSAPSPRGNLRELLDSISKAAVVGILALYVFGFLIVSIHNAEYGFSELNPLKPRIAAAGSLFTLFCVYPIVVARRLYSHSLQLNPEQRFSRAMVASLNFLSTCIFSAIVLARLYEAKPSQVTGSTSRWMTLAEIVTVLAFLVAWGWLMATGWTYFVKHPMKVAVGAFAIVMLLVTYLYHYSDKEILFAVALWFFAVGAGSELVRYSLKQAQPERRFTTNELLFPSILLLTFFALEVYPRVKPSWGGGGATPVVVYFSHDSRILPNQELQGDLLDESDNGVYVVKKGEKQAIFIPRRAIAAMYFSDKLLGPEFLKDVNSPNPPAAQVPKKP